MSRIKLNASQSEPEHEVPELLDDLIPNYALNKKELDTYKKVCDTVGAKIKDLMFAADKDEYRAGDWIAKRTVVHKETLDEAKLIQVLRKYDIPGIIKTKEYVDMDALEAYLYNMYKDETRLLDDSISAISRDIANCREVKEEVRLTVKAAKKKKEDE